MEAIEQLQTLLDLLVSLWELVLAAFGLLVFIVTKPWRRYIVPYLRYKKQVDQYYGKETRKNIARCYIRTRGQDIDPCEQDEIRDDNGKYISMHLVPFFCKEVFKESSRGKYYLVLADSGMGKSTFLLRLYRDYLFRFTLRKKKTVVLVPLSQQRALDDLKSIENPKDTILLLDALDENNEAIADYVHFFASLLKETEQFYRVIITCRTQFFPNRALEPEVTGRIRSGMGRKREEIVKKYLSPFTDEEVKQYLKKRYKFRKGKQKLAYDIVRTVPVLMARPIILNWIDFLCDSKSKYENSFQIYETIIDKWIEREALKNGKEPLFELSLAIADYMFENEITSMPAVKVDEIAKREDIDLKPIIAKSRSLLNRNGTGEYKFAHRSFLEYFIVYRIFEKMEVPEHTEFLFSLTGVRRFLFEQLIGKCNPEEIALAEQQLIKAIPILEGEKLINVVQKKEIYFESVKTSDGFGIVAILNALWSNSLNSRSKRKNKLLLVQTSENTMEMLQKEYKASLYFVVSVKEESMSVSIKLKVDEDYSPAVAGEYSNLSIQMFEET